MRSIRILGTGRYLPGQPIYAEEMDRRLNLPSGTCVQIAGVENRHYSNGEIAADMGAKAALKALQNAEISLDSIDAIVGASGTADQPIPCNAALIQKSLGLEDSGVACFDIGSTCLSFVTALDVMSYLIQAGRYKRVLIVSSEIASTGINPKQLESFTLFGDGAAAAVIGLSQPEQSSCLLSSNHQTFSSGAEFAEIKGGGSRIPMAHFTQDILEKYLFNMDGRKSFKQAGRVIGPFFRGLLQDANCSLQDLKLIIPHQASLSALEIMRRRLEVEEEKWMITVKQFGNTIASSIPIALDLAIEQKKIERGDKVMLLGTSAGFSIGGVTLEY